MDNENGLAGGTWTGVWEGGQWMECKVLWKPQPNSNKRMLSIHSFNHGRHSSEGRPSRPKHQPTHRQSNQPSNFIDGEIIFSNIIIRPCSGEISIIPKPQMCKKNFFTNVILNKDSLLEYRECTIYK